MNKSIPIAAIVISVIAICIAALPSGDGFVGGGQNSFGQSNIHATTTTTAAGMGQQVLTAQPGRQYAVITNTTATIAYLALNSTTTPNGTVGVADSQYTIPLAASGGTYVIDESNLYTGGVLASSSAAVTIRALQAY